MNETEEWKITPFKKSHSFKLPQFDSEPSILLVFNYFLKIKPYLNSYTWFLWVTFY